MRSNTIALTNGCVNTPKMKVLVCNLFIQFNCF